MGTGGTISGVGKFLKEKKPDIQIVGVDPVGSLYYDFVKTSVTKPYKVEGIGEDFFPATMNLKIIDDVPRRRQGVLPDDARSGAARGAFVGGSGGAAVAGAIKVAKENGRKKHRGPPARPGRSTSPRSSTTTGCARTASCPAGARPPWSTSSAARPDHDTPPLVTVASHERVKEAIDRLHAYSVSQLPVVHGKDPADLSSVVGSIQEGTLLERLFRKPEVLDAQVVDVMDPPFPTIEQHEQAEAAFELLSKGRSTAVLVTDHGHAVGVMTRSDLLDHLATRRMA